VRMCPCWSLTSPAAGSFGVRREGGGLYRLSWTAQSEMVGSDCLGVRHWALGNGADGRGSSGAMWQMICR
jgi:hypothetical protein